LIPDQEAQAARHGAALAIEQANRTGGWQFELVTRSTEGLWGSGSKESVNLVFEDEVVAILGSLDGRNAHPAEQVATKTRIAFLSAWATDMTLSQAFVPWYFRCIPNDGQQAAALLQEIVENRRFTRVATLATESYDARHASRTFARVAVSRGLDPPRQFVYPSPDQSLPGILASMERDGTEAIVLFGDPEFATEVMTLLKQKGMNQMIFGTLAVTDGQKAGGTDWSKWEGSMLVSSGHWFTAEGKAFQDAFRKTYGYLPGAAAAYAYDGTRVILEAVRQAGADRDSIIGALAGTNHRSGTTGPIQFDAQGNRAGPAGLMTVRNGKPSRMPAE
jgi:branched-chain amino acid transport system substrate-binding protein